MERTSPSHYIAPGAISVTPNANGSASDLAVYLVKGAKILVYSMGITALGWNDSAYRQWTLTGRNRRLTHDTKPYTIYARLSKNNSSDGYLIFAPKVADGDNWLDKYAYVTIKGLATGTANQNNSNYWYVKLGEVSLPVDGKRAVTLDTGILGTDQFNSEWNLDPDDMPLRVELTSAIDGVDAGDKPYVKWDKELILSAKLLEGWTNADVERFHHWTIQRNTGNASADAAWNFPTADSYAEHPSTGRKVLNGNIALSHARGEGDMFGGAVSSLWTVIAWGLKENDTSSSSSSSSSESSSASSSVSSSASSSASSGASSSSSLPEYVEKYEVLAQGTINILAETAEQYALELSVNMVNYDPTTDTYNPSEGIDVMVRATDQKGEVFKMTKAQLFAASLAVQFSVAALDQWNTCVFDGADEALAKANIPTEAFHLQKPVNVRIVKVSMSDSSSSSSSVKTTTYTELYRTPIAFVRNGEDSKDREWIFLRSQSAVSFSSDASDTTKPLIPSLISKGEVKPEEAAEDVDSNKNQDGWVPEGWWDEAQGTNDTYHYEYSAYRDYIKEAAVDSSSSGNSSSSADAVSRGGRWGDFSTPRIWSYYAEDAVNYRCRWTLAGVEVYQLKCAYTGAFRGTLPLVVTLMKRVGNGQEQEVTGKAVIVLSCDGIDFSKTFNADSPTFSVDAGNADTKDFIQYLNNVALNGLSTVFTVNGEAHTFSIPVIREADEDSVKDTVNKYGSKTFLSKVKDDTAKGKITFEKGILVHSLAKIAAAIVAQIGSEKFVDGFFGEGFQIWQMEESADWSMTIDRLTVRKFMTVYDQIIAKIRAVGGQLVVSAGNGKIKTVETDESGENYLIKFEDTNTFADGDLMRCQVWTGSGIKYYWVRISSSDMDTITVPISEFDGVQPEEGDECVLMGNTDNPLRQNLISISATEDGQPRIDVMNGISEKNFNNCLRIRLGNLDGIQDSWFPPDNQPHGDGLYADNAYLRGTFLLSTGEDIKTKFGIMEGLIQSSIEGVRNDFMQDKGFLNNPTFYDGLNHWTTQNDTVFFLFGNKWIWANNNLLSRKGDSASIVLDEGKRVVLIKNKSIVQKLSDYRSLPSIGTNSDGEKEPIAVYLSFFYKVRKKGTLTIEFKNVNNEGFIEYKPFKYEKELDSTDTYQQFTMSGLWNGTGDFSLSFSGEIYVYMLVLSEDEIESLTYKYRTLFEQSEKLVKIAAQNFDKDGNVLQESGIMVKPEGSGIYVVDKNGVGGFIGVSVEEDDGNGGKKSVIKLTANDIILEGAVTANGNFKILEDGSIATKNANLSGDFISADESRGNSIVMNAKEGYIKMVGPASINNADGTPDDDFRKDLWKVQFETDPDTTARVSTMYMYGGDHTVRLDPIDGLYMMEDHHILTSIAYGGIDLDGSFGHTRMLPGSIYLVDPDGNYCQIYSNSIKFFDKYGNILKEIKA